MKKQLMMSGLVMGVFLGACSNDEGDSENQGDEPNETAEETAETEPLEVIEVVEKEEGTFEALKRVDEIETQEVGSMVVDVEQVELGAAQLDGLISAFTGEENIHYVQLQLTVENQSDDDVHFSFGHTSLKTNTGEEVEVPNVVLSDETDHSFAANESKQTTLLYPVESVEGLNEIELSIEGPSETAQSDALTDDLQFTIRVDG